MVATRLAALLVHSWIGGTAAALPLHTLRSMFCVAPFCYDPKTAAATAATVASAGASTIAAALLSGQSQQFYETKAVAASTHS